MKKYIDIALNEISKGNFEKAIEISNKIIAEEPANHEGYELRGDCFYHMKKFDQAQFNYNEAAELAKQRDKNYTSQLYNKKGISNLKQNSYRVASDDFRKAVKYNPDNYKAYNNRSKALRLAGEPEDAVLDATRAINLKHDFAEAFNNRGSAYFNLSKTDECIDDFTKALKLKPGYAVAYFNRGAAYFYLKKDYLGAKLDWEKAISINPSYDSEVRDKIDAINLAYEKLAKKEDKESFAEAKAEEKSIPPEYKSKVDPERDITIRDGEFLSEGMEDLKPTEKSSILEYDKKYIEDEKHFSEEQEEPQTVNYIDEFLKEYETRGSFSDSFVEVDKTEVKEEKITEPAEEKFPDLNEFIKEKNEDTGEELPEIKVPDELIKLHSEINTPSPQPEINKITDAPIQEKPRSVEEKPKPVREKLIDRYGKDLPKEKKSRGYFWIYIIIAILLIAVIIMAVITSGVFDKKEIKETTAADTPKAVVLISEKSVSDTAGIILEKAFEEKLLSKQLILIETDSGFSFQAGSFKDTSLAVKKAELLEEKGYEPFIVRYEKDSTQILYRVRFGLFETISDADTAASEFK